MGALGLLCIRASPHLYTVYFAPLSLRYIRAYPIPGGSFNLSFLRNPFSYNIWSTFADNTGIVAWFYHKFHLCIYHSDLLRTASTST